ncbi:MAG: hypothetical protein C4293_21900 [Nitrospiraceae bacterium]
MRYIACSMALVLCVLAGCANKENLAKAVRITMPEAIRTAEASIPGGKAKETHLEKENGRTVYEVEMVDGSNNTRTVWVDAQTGRIVKTDK